MKKKSSTRIEAETAFVANLFRERAALNRKAQDLLSTGSRQVTIRLSNSEVDTAKQQAEA